MGADSRIDVGVLGATGMVGQQFISRLIDHPWFRVTWLAASERSEGKAYADAAPWRLATPMPDAVKTSPLRLHPGKGPKILFSALDAKAADELEHQFAAAGHIVLSNAKSHRMDPLVRC
jgi:aspartate-semialdehyde dehydrogenase